MKDIFIFTASNKDAQEHLEETILTPVTKKRLLPFLNEEQLSQIEEPSSQGEFYCWGATPGPRNIKTWEEMKSDDHVLIYYNKALHFYASVIQKFHDEDLATELWGTDSKGETWEYVYFLTKPKKIEPPIITREVSKYMHKQFQGFTKLSDERRDDLNNDFGSLENFISQSSDVEITNNKPMDQSKQELLITIKTKPFIILAGLSGTGKSRMVRTIAYDTCPDIDDLRSDPGKPGNYQLIKVRPNWHDSTEVIGYESRLGDKDKYIVTPFIRFIVKAWKYPDTPFFLCLDEMNLAPVEQYFAEYLSVFETRKEVEDGEIKTDDIIPPHIFKDYEDQLLEDLDLEDSIDLFVKFQSHGLTIPQNLVVMGTVNMDETTHSFSHKVLDRAMTIEKNHIDLEAGLEESNEDWTYNDSPLEYNQVMGDKIFGGAVYNDFSASEEVIEFLKEVNRKLKGTPFLAAYRVRDEFLIYCYHFSQLNDKPEDWLYQALDNMTHMKLLPKIEGEADQTVPALDGLEEVAEEYSLDRSIEKINQMKKKAERLRYTSYWY